MNNETIKKAEITIKLRGDNVYDLYVDGKWSASCGGCNSILNVLEYEVKKIFLYPMNKM